MVIKAAPTLQELITAAQAHLVAAGDQPTIRRDPYRLILGALSETLGVFGSSMKRWEETATIRSPLPIEDREALSAELVAATEKGAFEATRREAQRMLRRLDRGLAVKIGMSIAAAYIGGAMSVVGFLMLTRQGPFNQDAQAEATWHAIVTQNPDPRPALASATIQADRAGRRYYSGLSLWMDPPRPAPTGAP